MFSPEERARLRSDLLRRAEGDPRISAAALTGSAAEDREDRWSDIDLAFGVASGFEVAPVLADWTREMYERHAAVHHLDIAAGAWIYRVFLLRSGLQVDLAFVSSAEFRALGPTFKLVFGTSQEPQPVATASAGDLIGFAWLYALHVRSSMARGKVWQAEYMISGLRDHALALACLRHGLSTVHGRGFDELPLEVAAPFEGAIVRKLEAGELQRAFGFAIERLIGEMRLADQALASRLERTLRSLGSEFEAGA